MVVCALLGVLIEKVAYKPLESSRIAALTTAIAVSLLLEYGMMAPGWFRKKNFQG